MTSRARDPNLFKIIAGILVVGVVAFGVMRVAVFFQDYINQGVEAAAIENLERARVLAAEGHAVEAEKLLRPILARVDNPSISPSALMLQAELDQANGNVDAALEHLRAAAEDFPDGADQPVAALAYAKALEDAGRPGEAVLIYTALRDSAPPALRAPALTGLGREKERWRHLHDARNLYGQAMDDAEWGSEDWEAAADGFGRVNVRMLFSPEPTPDSKVYRVVAGDSLTSIGMKLNTTQGLLMRANGLTDPNRLRLNQNLKYTPKDFEIVIERSTLCLFLLDKDGLFRVYKVGLGKPGQDTVVGRYHIGNKEKDPTWYKPGFGPIEPGDPRNELGTRWMPLIPEEEGLPRDLGIHGTIDPTTIGQFVSNGCPRLYREEVEELYDLVVRSTRVTVVDTFNIDEWG